MMPLEPFVRLSNYVSSPLALHLVVFMAVSLGLTRWIRDEWRFAANHRHTGIPFTFKELAFYRMDYVLTTWAGAKPVTLLLGTYLLIMIGSSLYFLAAEEHVLFTDAIWIVWTFVADPGTHADENDTWLRLVSLIVTMGGMLIFALMIGIIADGVSELLDDLKKGKSRVIESGHTLLLGWSDKTMPTIREIAIANESLGGGVIVVLGERDKEMMEADLSSVFTPEQLKGTIVICRSGSPLIMNDLSKVSAQTAKSIIVFSDDSIDADESDARSVRVVMSLKGIDVGCHVVVEMSDIDNDELVHLVGKGMVETVVAHDIIGRLMIQCARQPGLAHILEKLLGFDGDEFYFGEWPELVGKTFLDASFAFDQAVVIGVKPGNPESANRQLAAIRAGTPCSPKKSEHHDYFFGNSSHKTKTSLRRRKSSLLLEEKVKKVLLNPPDDYVIETGDLILVIAEDDDTYKACVGFPCEEAKRARNTVTIQCPMIMDPVPEKILFTGWRRDMDDMIAQLDKLVCSGSELHLMCSMDVDARIHAIAESQKLDLEGLKNLRIVHQVGNPVLRRHLELLPLQDFTSLLILADEVVETNMQTSDSRSLASLLLIRDIIEKRRLAEVLEAPMEPKEEAPVISESDSSDEEMSSLIQDIRNRRNSRGTAQKKSLVVETDPVDWCPTKHASGCTRPVATTIISEILDSRTKSLIAIAEVSDYVMSNEIVACAMAMISEDRNNNDVLAELLSAGGAEIQVRSCLEYCNSGEYLVSGSFFFIALFTRMRRISGL